MVTSFLSMIYFGLTFNEQNSSRFTRMLICFPMFAAFAGARAFTLSVFLKETLGNTKEALGGVGVLAAFCAFNIICYKCENDLCFIASLLTQKLYKPGFERILFPGFAAKT